MITRNDTVRLLALAAAYDQRTVGDEDVMAWQMASDIGRWTFTAARRVVVEYYARDADRPRLTPALVSDHLRKLRSGAAESFEMPRLPDGLSNADYPAWLRRQRDAHIAAQLERWATSGEEPSRALPVAPAVAADLEQLVTRAPIQHRKAIGSGVRAMRERRVRLDPVQREQAHRELDEARRAADAGEAS